jgi:hypothetical protein
MLTCSTEVGDDCLYENGTIDWELLYIDNLERTLCWLCQFMQIWIANVMTDENFFIEVECICSVGGRLRLSLFASVDGIPIGGKGSWKNHVAVEHELSWACL